MSDSDPEYRGLLGIVGRGSPGAAISFATEGRAVGVIGERSTGRLFRLANNLGKKLNRGEGGAAKLPKIRLSHLDPCRNSAAGARFGAVRMDRLDGVLPDLAVIAALALFAVVGIEGRLLVRHVLASLRNRRHYRNAASGIRSPESGRRPVQTRTGRGNNNCRGDATHFSTIVTLSITTL